VITCKKCFNREDIFISVPAITPPVELEEATISFGFLCYPRSGYPATGAVLSGIVWTIFPTLDPPPQLYLKLEGQGFDSKTHPLKLEPTSHPHYPLNLATKSTTSLIDSWGVKIFTESSESRSGWEYVHRVDSVVPPDLAEFPLSEFLYYGNVDWVGGTKTNYIKLSWIGSPTRYFAVDPQYNDPFPGPNVYQDGAILGTLPLAVNFPAPDATGVHKYFYNPAYTSFEVTPIHQIVLGAAITKDVDGHSWLVTASRWFEMELVGESVVVYNRFHILARPLFARTFCSNPVCEAFGKWHSGNKGVSANIATMPEDGTTLYCTVCGKPVSAYPSASDNTKFFNPTTANNGWYRVYPPNNPADQTAEESALNNSASFLTGWFFDSLGRNGCTTSNGKLWTVAVNIDELSAVLAIADNSIIPNVTKEDTATSSITYVTTPGTIGTLVNHYTYTTATSDICTHAPSKQFIAADYVNDELITAWLTFSAKATILRNETFHSAIQGDESWTCNYIKDEDDTINITSIGSYTNRIITSTGKTYEVGAGTKSQDYSHVYTYHANNQTWLPGYPIQNDVSLYLSSLTWTSGSDDWSNAVILFMDLRHDIVVLNKRIITSSSQSNHYGSTRTSGDELTTIIDPIISSTNTNDVLLTVDNISVKGHNTLIGVSNSESWLPFSALGPFWCDYSSQFPGNYTTVNPYTPPVYLGVFPIGSWSVNREGKKFYSFIYEGPERDGIPTGLVYNNLDGNDPVAIMNEDKMDDEGEALPPMVFYPIMSI